NLSKIIEVDKILGLKLRESIQKALEIDPAVLQLAQERALKRKEGMFSYADNLREKIKTLGYQIFDLRDEKYIILNENF
ncbi:MAG: hypothetical protein NZO16_05915, partial [Deltaproteobacteria bacterium]|nr:hypothetical protein [Deltaproteobacteria bacterium]